MTDPIPQFPVVYGNVYPDGSAHINFAATTSSSPRRTSTTPERRSPRTPSRSPATCSAVPVRLTTVDPDGSWILAAHPDGQVTDLAPGTRPAKRPRRRDVRRPPPAAPGARPSAAVPPADRTEPVRPDPAAATCVLVTEPATDLPIPPRARRGHPRHDAPTWTPMDLPSEAEVTVFIERQQDTTGRAGADRAFSSGDVIRITGTALVGRRR